MNASPERLSRDVVDYAKQQLETHPVYAAIDSLPALRCFMAHHVYSVWDFMSLIKYLHASLPPRDAPWLPSGNTPVRRFVNELLMEEESDEAPPALNMGQDYISHCELYCQAMREIGGSPDNILAFIEQIRRDGLTEALQHGDAPQPSLTFTRRTFTFIDSGKPHVAAAALAFGREHVIPWMFRRILRDIAVDEEQAPAFHYYLKRHIHLDGDHHGPLSIALVEMLCEGDPQKLREAEEAARQAVDARIAFWDGVYKALQSQPAAC